MNTPRPLRHVGGVFRPIHAAEVAISVDFSRLKPDSWSPERVAYAIEVWADRVQTEYRSIQVMTRFLTEVLGAGDPLEVYAGASAAILDEIRHTALCVQVVEALGGIAPLPDPVVEAENPGFLRLSMAERALGTAVSMLAVSETLSTAYIEDLQLRCTHPVIRGVLDQTLDDEDTHHTYGWAYVAGSLARFEGAAHDFARVVVDVTLAPHEARAQRALAQLPLALQHLDAWPEPELAELGISSPQRQALVYCRVRDEVLLPKLRALSLR